MITSKRELTRQVMEKQPNWDTYLVEVLRGEVASREAELEALRASLRFKVGGWVLEAFPPGRGTMVLLVRLVRLLLWRRGLQPLHQAGKRPARLSDEMRSASVIVLGRETPSFLVQESTDLWRTQDAALVAQRLDMRESKPGLLVVRILSEQVLRRLERARQSGWRVVWHPEARPDTWDAALVAYIRAHADEVLETRRDIV